MASSDFPSYGSTVREYKDDPNYTDYSDRGPSSARYSEVCDQVSGNINNINSGANSLERAMKIIGTERDSTDLRDRIHETSLKTKQVVQTTTKLMKTLASMRRLERQQKFKIDRLQTDFQDAVRRFTTLQKSAAEKVKTSVKLTTPRQPDMFSGGWDDGDDKTAFVEQERRREELQAQGQIIEDDLALINEREERIRQLEADVLDVNEIFKDLNVMIHEQGEAVDSIEANVERAYGNVEEGTAHLGKASEYQKKSRKKLCILVVILVIIAAIVAIIIYTQVKK